MSDISQLDKNFTIDTDLGRDDIAWHDPRKEPFSMYGVYFDGECYRRMPEEVAKNVSGGVYELVKNTAGGRVCFTTDSDFVAISYKRAALWKMSHMALTGSAGFDMYIRINGKETYYGAFVPNQNSAGYDSILKFSTKEKREIILRFPLYTGATQLVIGLQDGACLEKWSGYKIEKPIVFYGSSITQGACASTPGTDYASRVSRRFDANYLNLGFSGNAKGEDAMMDYIASLDMSCFVYDYDYNAPNVAHLEKTHYKGYRKVRDANPDLPIVMMSAPNYDRLTQDQTARRDVIAASYERAIAEGDKNVYFVDGKKYFATFNADSCSVDGTHPNDHGFFVMAEAVIDQMKNFWN
jgi:lysophospholipase L1-like esterase